MYLNDFVGEYVLTYVPNLDIPHPTDRDASGISFQLNNTNITIFEDPDDGYRSHAGELITTEGYVPSVGHIPEWIHEKVICTYCGNCEDILEVRSVVTGGILLRVGTENTDDYYPWFVAQWSPENLSKNTK